MASAFSDIDVIITDGIASGIGATEIVNMITREYEMDRAYAMSIVETYLKDYNSQEYDYQNDYESNFEIDHDF